ncbi:MATH/TRAF domain - like 6 [Theobroma cacao]|nr:MATH/TRAF domain - like 6 [Theobroma cacao]
MEGNTGSANDEPQSLLFTWKVENFSRLEAKKMYSETVDLGGYKWRLLVFPNKDHLSIFLDVAASENLPDNWSVCPLFTLTVVNQIDKRYSVNKDTYHEFNERDHDWGFNCFMPLTEVYNPRTGYLVDDTCIIQVEISIGSLFAD